jgi:hypothetical protein
MPNRTTHALAFALGVAFAYAVAKSNCCTDRNTSAYPDALADAESDGDALPHYDPYLSADALGRSLAIRFYESQRDAIPDLRPAVDTAPHGQQLRRLYWTE